MNKTFKKALSLVLVLMMVVSTMVILPMTASAEDDPVGYASNPIVVSDAASAAALATAIPAATPDPATNQVYIVVTNDIDLGGAEAPVMNFGSISINLDGQGHTISNFTKTRNDHCGLFDALGVDCTISNFHVANATLNTRNGGAIVGYAKLGLWMINCSTAADVTVKATNNMGGGLAGTSQSNYMTVNEEKVYATRGVKIVNCVNNATVINTGASSESCAAAAAGIIGSIESAQSAYIENCTNNGAISGDVISAGIVGQIKKSGNITFDRIVNTGAITVTQDSAKGGTYYHGKAAAVAGAIWPNSTSDAWSITNVLNTGNITVEDSARPGKISVLIGAIMDNATGKMPPVKFDVSNCVNTGNLSMTSTKDTANENCFGFVWGFAQASEAYVATVNISNIYNSGNYTVNAPRAVGGMLIGRVHLYGTLNATNVYDAGVHSITTTSTDSAPLFGWGSGGELNKNLVNCYALQPVVNGDVNKNVSTNKSVSKATVYGPDGSTTATTTVYAWNGAAAQMPIHANSTLVASASTDIYLANATGTAYAKTSTIAAEGAAILQNVMSAIYAPDISTASGNLEVRLKLTDDFGLMAITEADGFYFSTDANVKNGTKVAGQAYNATGKVYAVYDEVTAATLDTTIYFAAYVTINGVDCLSEVRAINPYTMAKDLADGYYGAAGTGVLVTENTHEMALYTEMANYCDAYKAYMDAIA